MIRPSSPGTIWRRAWNTRCSRRSLSGKLQSWNETRAGAYWAVKDSSGWSASSPMRRRPFVRRDCTLHSTCTARPKWQPWCTRGSVAHLCTPSSIPERKSVTWRTYGFFLGPNWSAESLWRLPVTGSVFSSCPLMWDQLALHRLDLTFIHKSLVSRRKIWQWPFVECRSCFLNAERKRPS